MTTPSAGRQLDLQLHMLDRQVTDPDGHFVCNVDDLDFDVDEAGPYVTAILVGPRALGRRFGGRLGRWITSIGERLATDDQVPRIGFEYVTDIADDVRVNRTAGELGVDALERWTLKHLIARIPGSGHESK